MKCDGCGYDTPGQACMICDLRGQLADRRHELARARAEVDQLREVLGERYSMPQFPDTIFRCKDAARAVQNLSDNYDDLHAKLTELQKACQNLCPACAERLTAEAASQNGRGA